MHAHPTPRTARRLGAVLLCLGVLTLPACGGGGDSDAPAPPDDPVGMAVWIGEGRVVCDIAHARRDLGGFTAYGVEDREAQQEQAAQARLRNCRDNVEPGTRVSATLESSSADRAVVLLTLTAPSGGVTTDRMRFARFADTWVPTG